MKQWLHHQEVEIGNVQPLIAEAVSRRTYTIRQIREWEAGGLIDSERAQELVETQEGHAQEAPYSNAPVLWPELQSIVQTWRVVGEPVTVISGLAVGLQDNRPLLYPARIAWLTENGVLDSDHRALVLDLWAVLDEVRWSCMNERLRKQMETPA